MKCSVVSMNLWFILWSWIYGLYTVQYSCWYTEIDQKWFHFKQVLLRESTNASVLQRSVCWWGLEKQSLFILRTKRNLKNLNTLWVERRIIKTNLIASNSCHYHFAGNVLGNFLTRLSRDKCRFWTVYLCSSDEETSRFVVSVWQRRNLPAVVPSAVGCDKMLRKWRVYTCWKMPAATGETCRNVF
jgi:hypothetical protein